MPEKALDELPMFDLIGSEIIALRIVVGAMVQLHPDPAQLALRVEAKIATSREREADARGIAVQEYIALRARKLLER